MHFDQNRVSAEAQVSRPVGGKWTAAALLSVKARSAYGSMDVIPGAELRLPSNAACGTSFLPAPA